LTGGTLPSLDQTGTNVTPRKPLRAMHSVRVSSSEERSRLKISRSSS